MNAQDKDRLITLLRLNIDMLRLRGGIELPRDIAEKEIEMQSRWVEQLEQMPPREDFDRLVEFAAVQAIELRDNADRVDASTRYWRSLPPHLQDLVNAKQEELDGSPPINEPETENLSMNSTGDEV